jgi:hypothetical protein
LSGRERRQDVARWIMRKKTRQVRVEVQEVPRVLYVCDVFTCVVSTGGILLCCVDGKDLRMVDLNRGGGQVQSGRRLSRGLQICPLPT